MSLVEIILAVVAGAVIAIAVWQIWLDRRVRKIFPAEIPETHQEALSQLLQRVARLEKEAKDLSPVLDDLRRSSLASLQKVGFMRFNPFADTGGDQSFALAILDQNDNGIVVSSLYGREGTRVYAKAIERGEAKHPLSEEEKKVLEDARSRK